MLPSLPERHDELPLYIEHPRGIRHASNIEELASARLQRLCRLGEGGAIAAAHPPSESETDSEIED